MLVTNAMNVFVHLFARNDIPVKGASLVLIAQATATGATPPEPWWVIVLRIIGGIIGFYLAYRSGKKHGTKTDFETYLEQIGRIIDANKEMGRRDKETDKEDGRKE